jgi:protein TonB
VVLRLTLDERGGQRVIEIIEKGGFGFTEAAVLAVKKSIFSPAKKDGKPVVSRVLIPVKFVLRGY